jgi:HEPN domain-containing protein
VRPPRTHRLDEIIAQLRLIGCDLPDLYEECRMLEPYAVAVRYPERTPLPDQAAGRRTLAAARRIIVAAHHLLGTSAPEVPPTFLEPT